MLTLLFAALATVACGLMVWQGIVACRFPLHRREPDRDFAPGVTLLKPLKGVDPETAGCLRSWLQQDYPGPVQILFGVASAQDPVCATVRTLLAEFSGAELIICPERLGANAKVSTLAQLARLARHDILCLSDADVLVPPDLLAQIVMPLRESGVGLVSCFYEFSHPSTVAMRCEAVAVNADFWSQVLQARSLKPIDFALGAAMATTRKQVEGIGGFAALADSLADDYQLGHRIAQTGARVDLCSVVVQCRERPAGWGDVWQHQLRWARTIRVCQPIPYFFSILNNVTGWAVAWVAFEWLGAIAPGVWGTALGSRVLPPLPDGFFQSIEPGGLGLKSAVFFGAFLVASRITIALILQQRLTRSTAHYKWFWLIPIKDFLGLAIWLSAFLGTQVRWGGQRYWIRRDGRLVPVEKR